MADLSFYEAYRNNEFVVEIDGIESPGVTKVSGLSEGSVEPIPQPDGGSSTIHQISSGVVKYEDLTLERNVDGSAADGAFKSWFKEMFRLDGTYGGGSRLRKNGAVVHKQAGKEVQRFVFEGAWIKSSKFSDLEAGGTGLMKQTVVLVVERLYRA